MNTAKHMPDVQMSWTATPDGLVDFCSQSWHDYTGAKHEETIGRGWEQRVSPDTLVCAKSALDGDKDITTKELEISFRRYDGKFEKFLSLFTPLKDAFGNVSRWIIIHTKLPTAAESDDLDEQQFVSLADALPCLVWRADRELNVNFFNHQWYQYTGSTPAESLGQKWRQFFSDDMMKQMRIDWEKSIRNKTPYEGDQLIRSGEGASRWFLTRAYPLLNADGEIICWFGTNTDIHEQKLSAEMLERKVATRTLELELERDKAVTANAAKTSFLAVMSHEIRTPLSAVICLVELLSHSVTEDDDKILATEALHSSKQLLDLLNDLLDAAKLDAGKFQLENRPFNLIDVVSEVLILLKASAEKKGLVIEKCIQPGLPALVSGDELRMRQILINLASNAIKFTQTGYVKLHCEHILETAEEITVRFEVCDSGIGISEAEINFLFQPFSQSKKSTSRVYGGTGLGLNICDNLVTLMGGRIGVESNPGAGSKFWVEIPFTKVQN